MYVYHSDLDLHDVSVKKSDGTVEARSAIVLTPDGAADGETSVLVWKRHILDSNDRGYHEGMLDFMLIAGIAEDIALSPNMARQIVDYCDSYGARGATIDMKIGSKANIPDTPCAKPELRFQNNSFGQNTENVFRFYCLQNQLHLSFSGEEARRIIDLFDIASESMVKWMDPNSPVKAPEMVEATERIKRNGWKPSTAFTFDLNGVQVFDHRFDDVGRDFDIPARKTQDEGPDL